MLFTGGKILQTDRLIFDLVPAYRQNPGIAFFIGEFKLIAKLAFFQRDIRHDTEGSQFVEEFESIGATFPPGEGDEDTTTFYSLTFPKLFYSGQQTINADGAANPGEFRCGKPIDESIVTAARRDRPETIEAIDRRFKDYRRGAGRAQC